MQGRVGFVAKKSRTCACRTTRCERRPNGRQGDWSEWTKGAEVNSWMMVKLTEFHCQVKQDDDQSRSLVQQTLQKSTDFVRRIIVPVEGPGGEPHCRMCARRLSFEDCIWWVPTRHGQIQCNWLCGECGGLYNWTDPNKVLVSAGPSEAKVFWAHAPPHSCALSIFWRTSSSEEDSLVEVLVEARQIEDHG